jgi:hypothetical protein
MGSSTAPAGGGLAGGGCGDPDQRLRPGVQLRAGLPRPGQGSGQVLNPGHRDRRGTARPLVGSRCRALGLEHGQTVQRKLSCPTTCSSASARPRRHPADQVPRRRPEDRGRVCPSTLPSAVPQPPLDDAPQAGPGGEVQEDDRVSGFEADRQTGGVVAVDDPLPRTTRSR